MCGRACPAVKICEPTFTTSHPTHPRARTLTNSQNLRAKSELWLEILSHPSHQTTPSNTHTHRRGGTHPNSSHNPPTLSRHDWTFSESSARALSLTYSLCFPPQPVGVNKRKIIDPGGGCCCVVVLLHSYTRSWARRVHRVITLT